MFAKVVTVVIDSIALFFKPIYDLLGFGSKRSISDEYTVGQQIIVDSPDDANAKMLAISAATGKIVTSTSHWDGTNGIMTIESMLEPPVQVTEFEKMTQNLRNFTPNADYSYKINEEPVLDDKLVRTEAYYIWLETGNDAEWCWEEAVNRLKDISKKN